jgi:hypothetical protein
VIDAVICGVVEVERLNPRLALSVEVHIGILLAGNQANQLNQHPIF